MNNTIYAERTFYQIIKQKSFPLIILENINELRIMENQNC